MKTKNDMIEICANILDILNPRGDEYINELNMFDADYIKNGITELNKYAFYKYQKDLINKFEDYIKMKCYYMAFVTFNDITDLL